MIKENFQQALRPKSPLMRSGERESLTDNGSYRRAVLDRYIFRNISEVKEQPEAWLKDYNLPMWIFGEHTFAAPLHFNNYGFTYRPAFRSSKVGLYALS